MKFRLFFVWLLYAAFLTLAAIGLFSIVSENTEARAAAMDTTVYMPPYTTNTTTTTTTTATTAAPQTITVVATAYCSCEVCCGEWALNRPVDENGNEIIYTASGARAYANHTIAVDTDVFPFGTVLIYNGIEYVAEDTGSAIIGNKIDIYFDSHEEAWNWGRQEIEVIVKEG